MEWLVRAALGSAFGLVAVMLALSGSVMICREFFVDTGTPPARRVRSR